MHSQGHIDVSRAGHLCLVPAGEVAVAACPGLCLEGEEEYFC